MTWKYATSMHMNIVVMNSGFHRRARDAIAVLTLLLLVEIHHSSMMFIIRFVFAIRYNHKSDMIISSSLFPQSAWYAYSISTAGKIDMKILTIISTAATADTHTKLWQVKFDCSFLSIMFHLWIGISLFPWGHSIFPEQTQNSANFANHLNRHNRST